MKAKRYENSVQSINNIEKTSESTQILVKRIEAINTTIFVGKNTIEDIKACLNDLLKQLFTLVSSFEQVKTQEQDPSLKWAILWKKLAIEKALNAQIVAVVFQIDDDEAQRDFLNQGKNLLGTSKLCFSPWELAANKMSAAVKPYSAESLEKFLAEARECIINTATMIKRCAEFNYGNADPEQVIKEREAQLLAIDHHIQCSWWAHLILGLLVPGNLHPTIQKVVTAAKEKIEQASSTSLCKGVNVLSGKTEKLSEKIDTQLDTSFTILYQKIETLSQQTESLLQPDSDYYRVAMELVTKLNSELINYSLSGSNTDNNKKKLSNHSPQSAPAVRIVVMKLGERNFL